ncbi:MAG: LptF/LptG family permease [Treponema sp.]|nr:LptF/LptG family permease [Treponema sp.]
MTLDRYILRLFSHIFASVVGMFAFLVLLLDLVVNIVSFIENGVPFAEVLRISALFLPQAILFALPIALLFAAAYTLGGLYARGELTAVFAAGIPFMRFALPLLLLGLGASVFTFFLQDAVAIPALRGKTERTRLALNQEVFEQNANVVIKSRGGEIVYAVDYYDSAAQILNGVSVVERGPRGEMVSLIRAPRATWNGEHWVFVNAVIWTRDDRSLGMTALPETDEYRERPESFRRGAARPEDLSTRELRGLIADLRAAGLPHDAARADYHQRFSFPAVSFIVLSLALSMGGRFKKNILLISLLTSLGSAVIFYAMEMVTMMMARFGQIPAFLGAWLPVAFFLAISFLLLSKART